MQPSDTIPEQEGAYPVTGKATRKQKPVDHDQLRAGIAFAQVFIKESERELLGIRNHHRRAAQQLETAMATCLLVVNSSCWYDQSLEDLL